MWCNYHYLLSHSTLSDTLPIRRHLTTFHVQQKVPHPSIYIKLDRITPLVPGRIAQISLPVCDFADVSHFFYIDQCTLIRHRHRYRHRLRLWLRLGHTIRIWFDFHISYNVVIFLPTLNNLLKLIQLRWQFCFSLFFFLVFFLVLMQHNSRK